jgi:hypothetical protein
VDAARRYAVIAELIGARAGLTLSA